MAVEQEQQKFESPEKLARALEAKSDYYLASKVRQIGNQVQGNSIDWRAKLKSDLTHYETEKLIAAL
jgi:hypothetical protein